MGGSKCCWGQHCYRMDLWLHGVMKNMVATALLLKIKSRHCNKSLMEKMKSGWFASGEVTKKAALSIWFPGDACTWVYDMRNYCDIEMIHMHLNKYITCIYLSIYLPLFIYIYIVLYIYIYVPMRVCLQIGLPLADHHILPLKCCESCWNFEKSSMAWFVSHRSLSSHPWRSTEAPRQRSQRRQGQGWRLNNVTAIAMTKIPGLGIFWGVSYEPGSLGIMN